MTWGETDTLAKLLDPAIHRKGWTEDHIKRELTAGATGIIDGQLRRRARGRVHLSPAAAASFAAMQSITVAVLGAKAEYLRLAHGLEEVKAYPHTHTD